MQHRTLVRCSNLAGFRQALIELALSGAPLSARRRVVIVPTHASAELLRQTIESAAVTASRRAIVLPDFLTRDEWMTRLHVALPGAPPLLGRVDREVILARAARSTGSRERMPGMPFPMRPGLVAAMLDLYDELRRRQRNVRRFARSLFDQLRVERGTDRGSEGLIHQTCFLGFTFLAYERAVAASGAMDEHVLRRLLVERQPGLPFDHVVIAVADRPTDPRGLWPADFDLVGRLTGLARVDVVVTDEAHDAGLRERAERELPGLSEARRDVTREPAEILTPADAPDAACFMSRDREEELRDVARAIRARVRPGDTLREPTAIVFHRPLPYLYLAQQVLTDAAIPYQALDALPLASEPYAALLDLVLAVARTGGTRETMTTLLRSRLVDFREAPDAPSITGLDVAALDAALGDRRAVGEADTYVSEIEGLIAQRRGRPGLDVDRALLAARMAVRIRDELAAFRAGPQASAQVAAIAAFLRRHEYAPAPEDAFADRQARARAAVLGVLDDLIRALRHHDDRRRPPDDLVALIHHQIEARTFAPGRSRRGVQLVDAVAARFGRFDHVHLVGLVETDWPERTSRSIFYTSGLLKALGWPQEPDHVRAQQAAFRDLLALAGRTTTLHAFQLDGDAIVGRSPLIDAARETTRYVVFRGAGLPPEHARTPLFADEILALVRPPVEGLAETPRRWLEVRQQRPPLDDRRYRGFVAPIGPRPYRVSRVDRYVDCPFKFFSEDVLGLPEEREEMSGLTPLERGTLVHELFERFYRAWQAKGEGTITPATLPAAVSLFATLTREALAGLPAPDRALEETRLLGSIVARGLAERVFELESDAGGRIVDRLLECDLRGTFTFPQLHSFGQTSIDVRGKADRVDVFDDGSVRVIDYKLGRLPDLSTSIQIGVYAHCVRSVLAARDGRSHPVRAAMYLAFGDDRKLEGALGSASQPAELAVDARASAFASIVERVEAGEFPARPLRPGECQWCKYALVCRKEYAPDSDEAAEPV